jgi:hypothetical protein
LRLIGSEAAKVVVEDLVSEAKKQRQNGNDPFGDWQFQREIAVFLHRWWSEWWKMLVKLSKTDNPDRSMLVKPATAQEWSRAATNSLDQIPEAMEASFMQSADDLIKTFRRKHDGTDSR